MSYQVLARKWRPKDFSEILGQEVVCRTLIGALRSHRLPHALLFTGSRGTGKTSTARILAKILRCTQVQNTQSHFNSKKAPDKELFSPCHKCKECLSVSAGSHPYVLEIDGASHNGVEAIRELTNGMAYSPTSGHHKIYIIDEVHMLSINAFNALLKTLEEPPLFVVFILATTEIQKIPETVLSRCQRLDFKRIPIPLIAKQLEKICKAEKIQAKPQALWQMARYSKGSLRDAESLLDQMISFLSETSSTKNSSFALSIDLENSSEVLGWTNRKWLKQALKFVIQGSPKDLLHLVKELYEKGAELGEFTQDFLEEIRNLMLVKVFSDSPSSEDLSSLLNFSEEDILELKEIGKSLLKEDIHLLFDMALKGSEEVLNSSDPRIALEMLLLRMSQAPSMEQLSFLGGPLPSQGKRRELSFSCEEHPTDL